MRALRFGFALVLAACGGEGANMLERAATPIPPELGAVTTGNGWFDPTAPVPVPPPLAMDDRLLPARPALPMMDDPTLPVVPPAMLDGRPDIPPLGIEEPLRPALPPPGGIPFWWRPPQVATEPTLAPRVWAAAAQAHAGDAVDVAVANLRANQRVVLALAAGAPDAYRFCGSGFADAAGNLTGACRLPYDQGPSATIVAYEGEIDGPALASTRVGVVNATGAIDVGTPVVAHARFVPLAGDAAAHHDVLVRVHDPYGATFVATTVKADADGRWMYVLALPINATLGRWTVLVPGRDGEDCQSAWFDVAPIAGVEVTPDLVGAYVLGLMPYDDVSFRFYDARGREITDLAGVANEHGWAVLNGDPPACAVEGTWFVRVQYHDTRGDATWMDVNYGLHVGWCLG